jgi:hypothetical protein
VTTLRIAHAEPRPGKLPSGGFQTRGHLVVLAGDTGHRTAPVPAGTNTVAFGIFLVGPGRIELRDAQLTRDN